MDPYLERRGLWEEVHTNLIVGIQQFLAPLLRPRYRIAIERRSYLALLPPAEQMIGMPDLLVVSASRDALKVTAAAATSVAAGPVIGELPMPEEVLERYLEIRDAVTQEVITVIEILSPTNKTTAEGREQYQRKRLKILGSLTNLVEIDLLRGGDPFEMKVPGRSDYRIVVSRSERRPRADFYLFGVRQAIPDFPIPLRPNEAEPTLPLNQILHTLYDQSGYDLAIDYGQSPEPPLTADDIDWATQLLADQYTAR
jgi:hypothetical protein